MNDNRILSSKKIDTLFRPLRLLCPNSLGHSITDPNLIGWPIFMSSANYEAKTSPVLEVILQSFLLSEFLKSIKYDRDLADVAGDFCSRLNKCSMVLLPARTPACSSASATIFSGRGWSLLRIIFNITLLWWLMTLMVPQLCLSCAYVSFGSVITIDWLIVLGFNYTSILRVIVCRLPERGRKEIEETAEEMKERDGEVRGTGMKGKKQKK